MFLFHSIHFLEILVKSYKKECIAITDNFIVLTLGITGSERNFLILARQKQVVMINLLVPSTLLHRKALGLIAVRRLF